MAQKEAQARIRINELLAQAGWRFFDTDEGQANVQLEPNVTIKQKDIDALGEDFERVDRGFIDYLLLDEKSFPLVVLEAKSEKKNPLDGKEQARKYAQNVGARFVLLSNGNMHYLWDLERGNPTVVTQFPNPDSFVKRRDYKPNPQLLLEEKVGSDYVVLTQRRDYATEAGWINEDERPGYIDKNRLKFLRPYQVDAVHALQEAAKNGSERYLFEMATGTGKTLTAAAVIKLFLKTGNASRVLFLVDRIELEDQAEKAFKQYLGNDFQTVTWKKSRNEWRSAEIVVSTVQSLNDKYERLFSPTDFDLIISDESHRSIGGNSRAVFEYFVGYKLGLTATPRDYLKSMDPGEMSEKDPRSWERRQLLDTYVTFGCDNREPTFRYSLLDGVKQGYLINPIVVDARTEITTQLLSDKGYAMMVQTEDGLEEEQIFFQRDFERKFFSEKTNKIFAKTFLENALTDPISGETGKSIMFCVSQHHAAKMTQILNEFAELTWPGRYNSDFAVQVTSNVMDAQRFTVNFANNNLNGHTKVLESYESSKTRICVTMGMMTTGYDCQDILNVVLMRPIFSPTDFIQIKGRGTRKFSFKYEEITAEKSDFKLFDFFANCEYFEEKYDYDQVLKLPQLTGRKIEVGSEPAAIDEIKSIVPDPLKTIQERAVGVEGMKVDRKMYERLEDKVKGDEYLREAYFTGDYQGAEDYMKTEVLDKPNDFITLDKLSKLFKVGRRLGIRELLGKIFGDVEEFTTKDQLLEGEFQKYLSIVKPDPGQVDVATLKSFFKAYVTDDEIRKIIDNKRYGQLATNASFNIDEAKELGKDWLEKVPSYVKDYVTVNTYMS